MRYLILILGLLLAAPSFAGQGIIPSAIYYASGGSCTEPASGTVILGTSTTSTATAQTTTANLQFAWNTNSAATWSETCTTTTMATAEVYAQGWGGGYCKMIIMDSSGNIITNGTSSQNATIFDYEDAPGWKSFSFSTPPTLTKGTNYRFGIVCGTADGLLLPFNDTGTDTFGYIDTDASHSFSTPGNMSFPLGHAIDDSATFGGFRGKK